MHSITNERQYQNDGFNDDKISILCGVKKLNLI